MVVSDASLLDELVAQSEVEFWWIDADHQRKEVSSVQLIDFRHSYNIEELQMLLHAHHNIPGLNLLQAVEVHRRCELKISHLIFGIAESEPANDP